MRCIASKMVALDGALSGFGVITLLTHVNAHDFPLLTTRLKMSFVVNMPTARPSSITITALTCSASITSAASRTFALPSTHGLAFSPRPDSTDPSVGDVFSRKGASKA